MARSDSSADVLLGVTACSAWVSVRNPTWQAYIAPFTSARAQQSGSGRFVSVTLAVGARGRKLGPLGGTLHWGRPEYIMQSQDVMWLVI